MIRVLPAPEPPGFDAAVRKPGCQVILERMGWPSSRPQPCDPWKDKTGQLVTRVEDLPSKAFLPLWTKALDDLMSAYNGICAYSCFRIHPVTGANSVDHMAPKSKRWDRVYEWDNYRLASGRMNGSKSDYEDVLDPFEIEDGWFVLELVGFQVKPADELDAPLRTQVQATIVRLKLNEDTLCEARAGDAEKYWGHLGPDEQLSFASLFRGSPFVARELHRQGRLNTRDQGATWPPSLPVQRAPEIRKRALDFLKRQATRQDDMTLMQISSELDELNDTDPILGEWNTRFGARLTALTAASASRP